MPEWGPFDVLDNLSPEDLRQRLRSLQAIIERAPIPIAIAHDPECRFIFANRALASLMDVPQDANISLTPPVGEKSQYRIQRGGKDIAPDDLPMQYAIAHRTAVSNEIEIVRADGSVLYVQNDVEPLYDTHGQIYGCVSVVVDLTERKLAETGLRNADRRKDEFLATLSHELRNPLAPIRSAIEVIRLAHGDQEIIEKARATMERQLLHLVRITDDLLDVARITQDKVQLRRERIDLRAVMQSAIEATRPMIDAQGHTLTVQLPEAPVWADVDFTRIAQALSNLLSNAAKYTEPGGQIGVTAASDANTATITVTDTGIGIPPVLLPRIFDMFTQLQAHRDRTYGGLGIGLTLSRRLVQLHGGAIDASSGGPGRGSQFTIRLPLENVPRGKEARPEAEEGMPRQAGCRVLVAEDSPDAAEMLSLMLSIKGHDVRVAADGEQAVAIGSAFEPQIAFVDIGLPRMDGFEVARHLRELLGRRVLLVALTGWGQDEDRRRSREAGFDHHLTKPPEPEVLDRLIAECMQKRG
jgi:signal transduction histidine kinase/ActR/RegA family two-component response regulator